MRDNDRESYETFFENFGRGLKFGIYSSYGMKADELGDLLPVSYTHLDVYKRQVAYIYAPLTHKEASSMSDEELIQVANEVRRGVVIGTHAAKSGRCV